MGFPFFGDGVKGFFAGFLLAGVVELSWHMFWHFTVPGATIAMEIAEFTGLTEAFAQGAGGGAEFIGHSADNCDLPFCPIHNPDLSAFGEAAGGGAEGLFQAPPAEPVSPPPADAFPDLPELPDAGSSSGPIPFPSQTQFSAGDLPALSLAA